MRTEKPCSTNKLANNYQLPRPSPRRATRGGGMPMRSMLHLHSFLIVEAGLWTSAPLLISGRRTSIMRRRGARATSSGVGKGGTGAAPVWGCPLTFRVMAARAAACREICAQSDAGQAHAVNVKRWAGQQGGSRRLGCRGAPQATNIM